MSRSPRKRATSRSRRNSSTSETAPELISGGDESPSRSDRRPCGIFVLGAQLVQFLLALRQLLAGDRDLRVEFFAPRFVSGALHPRSSGSSCRDFGRHFERLAVAPARRRAALAASARILHAAFLHRETKRVSSIFSSICSGCTICPSRTRDFRIRSRRPGSAGPVPAATG